MLTPRQELLLGKVVDGFNATGQPVGSKMLASDLDVEAGASTIRNELAVLEEQRAARPSAHLGRPRADRRRLPLLRRPAAAGAARDALELQLSLVRREVDEAMRVTTETLSQVTNLLAIVSAPPIATTTLRHVEVLPLQPQVLMVVVITSTGGVSKRVFTFDRPVDPGLADWASAYLNEELTGMGIGVAHAPGQVQRPRPDGARARLHRAARAGVHRAGDDGGEHALRGRRGAAAVRAPLPGRLPAQRAARRCSSAGCRCSGCSRAALDERDIYVRIGGENEMPALRSLSLVAGNYGLPQRNLGTVSVIGPMRMDYAQAIITVREAALQLSRFVEDIYE